MVKRWNCVVVKINDKIYSGYIKRCDQAHQQFLVRTKAGEAWFPRTMIYKIGTDTIEPNFQIKGE